MHNYTRNLLHQAEEIWGKKAKKQLGINLSTQKVYIKVFLFIKNIFLALIL